MKSAMTTSLHVDSRLGLQEKISTFNTFVSQNTICTINSPGTVQPNVRLGIFDSLNN
jgi:hypothetical protein